MSTVGDAELDGQPRVRRPLPGDGDHGLAVVDADDRPPAPRAASARASSPVRSRREDGLPFAEFQESDHPLLVRLERASALAVSGSDEVVRVSRRSMLRLRQPCLLHDGSVVAAVILQERQHNPASGAGSGISSGPQQATVGGTPNDYAPTARARSTTSTKDTKTGKPSCSSRRNGRRSRSDPDGYEITRSRTARCICGRSCPASSGRGDRAGPRRRLSPAGESNAIVDVEGADIVVHAHQSRADFDEMAEKWPVRRPLVAHLWPEFSVTATTRHDVLHAWRMRNGDSSRGSLGSGRH